MLALCTLGAGCADPAEELVLAEHVAAIVSDPPLVISQVYGAGGNAGATYNADFVEIFNRSAASVALDAFSLQYASATGTANFGSASQLALFPAGATLAPGQYYLVRLASGTNGVSLPSADVTPIPTIAMAAGAGKIALVTGTSSLGCNGGSISCDGVTSRIVDLVAYGAANFSETAPTPTLGATTAARRLSGGCTDTNNNAADFEVVAPAPRNTATAAAPCGGDQAPSVASTSPSHGASHVDPSAVVSVTFSEPVSLTGSWFTFSCGISGAITASVSGGPTTFTLTPTAPLGAGETCQLQLTAASILDLDSADPPDQMVANYSFSFSVSAPVVPLAVHTVQGSAHLSPHAGQVVTVGPAVVTALRSNGFFMEDLTPDADLKTSEGLFVFTSSAPSVAVGHVVKVTGTVSEYRPGCSGCTPSDSAYANLTTTELENPTVSVQSTGQTLPPPVVLGSGPGQRSVPLQVIDDDAAGNVETSGTFQPDSDGIDFYESLEGMRVQIDQPVVVGPTRSFSGGSMEIGVLARPDAGLRTPRGGIVVASDDFNPERLILANGLVASPSFPNLNVGTVFQGSVVGVLDYNFANYKLQVSEALPSVTGNLSAETTALSATLPSQLSIASLNVENLDPTDPPSKFAQLAAIVVNNLGAPALIALEEVQDNNGATDNGVVDASTTLNTFIAAIAAAGGPAYAYRLVNPQNDQDGGEPGGNIRVVFLFRTDTGLAFVDRGAATSTTANGVDASSGSPHLSFSPGRIDPTNGAFSTSRKPLAGEFTFRGQTFFVIANHFNSKGGDDPLFGRLQPPTQSSRVQRLAQANVVSSFVSSLLTADSHANIIVLGDLNDFSFSPPLVQLKSAGLVDMIETLPPNERYTYVYEGNSQDLDHIMVGPSLASRASYDIVHVNAEFAQQASDHEPSVLRIELGDAPVISMGNGPGSVAVGSGLSFQVTATGTPAPTFALLTGPAGMVINAQTGLVTWTPNVAPGDYPFTVQASNGVGSVTRQYSVTVLSPVGVPALTPLAALCLVLGLLAIGLALLRRQQFSHSFEERH